MRILIVTKQAWDDTISSGNTLTNLFSGWPGAVFYTLCCRDALPNNRCCSEYFTVSPTDIVKNIITPWRIGRRFTVDNQVQVNETARFSRKAEASLKNISKKIKMLSSFYEIIYSTKLWLNRKLKAFVQEASPDIVFCFGVPDVFNYLVLKYIKDKYNIPVVSYFVDNHYVLREKEDNYFTRKRNRRLYDIAFISSRRYCITQMMCDWYSQIMHLDFKVLTKGCDVSENKCIINNPLRIVYAGNLLFGRDNTLFELVKALEVVNQLSENKCYLEIYTATNLDEDTQSKFNVEGISKLFPAKPYTEITEIMKAADIVLHVESFNQKQMDLVRYSFSTKITDCLQSGAMIMAIGPDSLASIDYLNNVPGTIVITDVRELESVLSSLLNNSQIILNNAHAANEYARKELAINCVRDKLHNDFNETIKR